MLAGVWWRVGRRRTRSSNKSGVETTALQMLINGCWMDAVQWLAEKHHVSLQGLVIEKDMPEYGFDAAPFRVKLQLLQKQQRQRAE